MTDVPWLVPGLAIALVVSLVAGRGVGRHLSTSSLVGGTLVFSLGLILSATLTPGISALEVGSQSGGTCELTLSLPGLAELLAPSDFSLNILLFLPLGFSLGLISRPSLRVALVGSAVALPLIVEWTQMVIPALARTCQINDVAANEIGLLVGVASGWAFQRLRGSRLSGPRPDRCTASAIDDRHA